MRHAEAAAEVKDIDGVRVRQDGGWWLLGTSNTQHFLVVRCEAPDGETLQTLVGRVRDELAACGLTLPI